MYDLIIVGGGMSGISVGHFFRDQNILLLERGPLLSGATGNNAGFLISGFGEHYNNTAKRWGRARAREIQEIHLSSHRRIHELATLLHCDFKRCGSLSLAWSEKEKADLQESHELMLNDNFPVEWWENPGLGLKEKKQGLFNPRDGILDARQFWRRLAEGLPALTGCEVRRIHPQQDSILVETSQGDFHARQIVFCLNAFAAPMVRELQGRYIPLRGQMLEIPDVSSPESAPVITDYGEVYWRFTGQSLLFGGLEYTVPEEEVGIASDVSHKLLQKQLQWICSAFASDGLPASWISEERAESALDKIRFSTMSFSIDGFPFIGRLPAKNQYVLSALCGLGHSYAMEGAAWLYELICHDRDVIPAYCSSDRIMRLPVYTGGNWRTLYEAWNH